MTTLSPVGTFSGVHNPDLFFVCFLNFLNEGVWQDTGGHFTHQSRE